MEITSDKGLENLLIAIVVDACKSLIALYGRVDRRKLRGLTPDRDDLLEIKFLEDWFRGPEFEWMCNLDPEYLIEVCRKMAGRKRLPHLPRA